MKRASGVRADRINAAELTPESLSGPPSAPAHLDEVGAEVWERLAPSLVDAGVLIAWDLDLFAVLCDLVSITRQAAMLVRNGLVMKGRRDGVVTSPAWRVYRDAVAALRNLAREFGLTPSARSGLTIDVTLRSVVADAPSPRTVKQGT